MNAAAVRAGALFVFPSAHTIDTNAVAQNTSEGHAIGACPCGSKILIIVDAISGVTSGSSGQASLNASVFAGIQARSNSGGQDATSNFNADSATVNITKERGRGSSGATPVLGDHLSIDGTAGGCLRAQMNLPLGRAGGTSSLCSDTLYTLIGTIRAQHCGDKRLGVFSADTSVNTLLQARVLVGEKADSG